MATEIHRALKCKVFIHGYRKKEHNETEVQGRLAEMQISDILLVLRLVGNAC